MSRYSRLLQLTGFSYEKLKILQSKNVLIVGAGGLGQHISTYLVTNGIEKLAIVDFDKVEISNLNRQILLTEKDIGQPKVEVVKRALNAKNDDAEIEIINTKIDTNNVSGIVSKRFDVVVDALDNWEGKLIVSDECHKQNIPFLHIGVDGMSGQFCLFKKTSLRDLLSDEIISEPRDGVIGSMVGAVAALSTTFLIKYLLGEDVPDELHYYDYQGHKFEKIKIPE